MALLSRNYQSHHYQLWQPSTCVLGVPVLLLLVFCRCWVACSQLDELHLGPVHSVHKYLTHSTASLSREDSPPPPADLATAAGLLVVQIFRYLSWLIFLFVNLFFLLLSSVFEPGCDTVHVFPSTPYCQLRYFSYYDQIVCADPNRRWVYPTNKYCVCVHQLCRRAQLFFKNY